MKKYLSLLLAALLLFAGLTALAEGEEIIDKGNRITWIDASVTHPDDYATNIIGFKLHVKLLTDNTNGVDGYGGIDENGQKFPTYMLCVLKGQHDETELNENTFYAPEDENFEHYTDEALAAQEIVKLGVGDGHYVASNLDNGKDIYSAKDCPILKAGDEGVMVFQRETAIFDEGNPWLTLYGYTAEFEILSVEWITGAPSLAVEEEPWEKVATIEYEDVSTVEDEALQNGCNYVDITIPDTGEESYPVILWVHGGAWTTGSRKDVILNNTRDYLLANGFAFVSCEYTMSTMTDSSDFTTVSNETQGRQMIYDLKLAIRFLRANAETYHLNTDFICAMGESAGAHLSLLLGTTNGDPDHEDLTMGWANESSDVQLMVSYSGPTDITEDTAPEDSTNLMNAIYVLGYDFVMENLKGDVNFAGHNEGNADLTDAEMFMSPYQQVNADTPAMYLIQGEQDGAVATYQVTEMVDIASLFMEEEVKTAIYPLAGHVDKMYFDAYGQYTDTCSFIKQHLEATLGQ